MPTRFCLKNIGDPSSITMVKATTKKTGDKIIKIKLAKRRFTIEITN